MGRVTRGGGAVVWSLGFKFNAFQSCHLAILDVYPGGTVGRLTQCVRLIQNMKRTKTRCRVEVRGVTSNVGPEARVES